MIVTTFARQGYLRRALDAGVKGYLLKDSPAETTRRRRCATCIAAARPSIRRSRWKPGTNPIRSTIASGRRCACRAKDCRAPQIAEQLGLSAGTVRNYLSEAIGKLGANNRIDAYRLARQRGWL